MAGIVGRYFIIAQPEHVVFRLTKFDLRRIDKVPFNKGVEISVVRSGVSEESFIVYLDVTFELAFAEYLLAKFIAGKRAMLQHFHGVVAYLLRKYVVVGTRHRNAHP